MTSQAPCSNPEVTLEKFQREPSGTGVAPEASLLSASSAQASGIFLIPVSL